MAAVSDAKTALGSGANWFKVSRMGLVSNNPDYFGSRVLNDNCGHYTLKIPANLAPGNYLIRAEVIWTCCPILFSLCMFYPACFQVNAQGLSIHQPRRFPVFTVQRPWHSHQHLPVPQHLRPSRTYGIWPAFPSPCDDTLAHDCDVEHSSAADDGAHRRAHSWCDWYRQGLRLFGRHVSRILVVGALTYASSACTMNLCSYQLSVLSCIVHSGQLGRGHQRNGASTTPYR